MGRTSIVGIRVAVIAATALALLIMPTSASAGRLVATGHDTDDHCSDSSPEQCGFLRVATNYVRKGAPDPNKKVLLLDCNGGVRNALNNAFSNGLSNRRVCPSDDASAFNKLPLTTSKFSAVLVGSSCDDSDDVGIGNNTLNLTEDLPGGCEEPGGSTPDSDLINKRKGDIKAFFNQGGGIFAMSGVNNGDGDPSNGPDRYYRFLPLDAQGVEVTSPFCLTNLGIALGFEDQDCPDPSKHSGTRDDINCCPTHNSFAEPEPGPLKVAERDDDDFAETLVADAQIRGGKFVADKKGPRATVKGVPAECTREDFSISVRLRDPAGIRSVRVLLDDRLRKKTTKRRFDVSIRASGLSAGQHRIKVRAVDQDGNVSVKVKRFTRCAGGVGGPCVRDSADSGSSRYRASRRC